MTKDSEIYQNKNLDRMWQIRLNGFFN